MRVSVCLFPWLYFIFSYLKIYLIFNLSNFIFVNFYIFDISKIKQYLIVLVCTSSIMNEVKHLLAFCISISVKQKSILSIFLLADMVGISIIGKDKHFGNLKIIRLSVICLQIFSPVICLWCSYFYINCYIAI